MKPRFTQRKLLCNYVHFWFTSVSKLFQIHSLFAMYFIVFQTHMRNVAKSKVELWAEEIFATERFSSANSEPKEMLEFLRTKNCSWKIFSKEGVDGCWCSCHFYALENTGRLEGKKVPYFQGNPLFFSAVQARCHFYSYRYVARVDFTEIIKTVTSACVSKYSLSTD